VDQRPRRDVERRPPLLDAVEEPALKDPHVSAFFSELTGRPVSRVVELNHGSDHSIGDACILKGLPPHFRGRATGARRECGRTEGRVVPYRISTEESERAHQ
jgi:hypothetical protein